MIRINFTDADVQTLRYERYHHPHPRVQQKAEALLMKSCGFKHQDICKFMGISLNTFREYLREYQEGGIERIKEVRFHQPKSQLDDHRDTLENYFREHPVASIKEAMNKIEELTGIHRSENRVREFLKRMGIKRRKVGMIPAKADPEQQEEFVKQPLNPKLEEAKKGQRAVLFVDAAHFVLCPFLGFLWAFSRIFIRAPAGRNRFNVLGALNAITHELTLVFNDTYINAQSVCDLLRKIADLYVGRPITIILDNARYQKCKLVQEVALSLKIELLYLPPYSPNLNLIERLWKFVKKKCLWSKYYSNFKDFKEAIMDCLNQTHTTYKKELKSLLNLKFQSFKEAQVTTV
jgi:transposase